MVSGSNNIINLDGGINISGDSGGHFIKGVQVTGNNSVNISGHSVMNTRQVLGTFSLISVADGGNVVFDESAVTDIQSSTRDFPNYFIGSVIIAMGSQSAIRNNGIVNTTDAQELMMANSGGRLSMPGRLILGQTLNHIVSLLEWRQGVMTRRQKMSPEEQSI